MAVPFGFSAGDFIAALKIVKDVTDALRESGGAGEEYRQLVNELYTLETALLEVKRVDLDDEQHAQRVALQQAASQCHRTIDEFWKKIQKYQPHLRSEGSSSKVKDGWRKVQWALCKKDDVANFRAKLRGHTGSINVLVMTVQMNSTAIDRKRNDRSRQTLEAQLQQNTFAHLGMLQDIANGVNGSVQQGEELLLSTATVLRTNVQIFQLVLGLQNHVLSLPSQVERQQPVTFFDACGRVYPFHLDFINSAEAFRAVLRVKFKDIGLAKFDRGEYVIKETATNREIDLSRPWDQCFLPGQKADMSMVFYAAQGNTCPGCQSNCGDTSKAEVVCLGCGMTVHRITEIEEKEKDPTADHKMNDVSKARPPKAARKRKRSFDDDEEVGRFRRVRIVTRLQAKLSSAARANALLIQHGIDPNLLTETQLNSFQQQNPAAQNKALQAYAQNLAQHERSALKNQVPKGMLNPTQMPGQASPMMQQGGDPQQLGAMGNYYTEDQVSLFRPGSPCRPGSPYYPPIFEEQNTEGVKLSDIMNHDHTNEWSWSDWDARMAELTEGVKLSDIMNHNHTNEWSWSDWDARMAELKAGVSRAVHTGIAESHVAIPNV